MCLGVDTFIKWPCSPCSKEFTNGWKVIVNGQCKCVSLDKVIHPGRIAENVVLLFCFCYP